VHDGDAVGGGTVSERATDRAGLVDALVGATALAFGGYAAGYLVLVALATTVEAGGVEVFGNSLRTQIAGTIAIQGVAFLGGSLAFLAATDRWDLLKVDRPSLRELGLVVVGYALLLGSFFGVSSLYGALGVSTAESGIVAAGRANPTLLLYLIPLSVVLVGPGEELFYRGLVQGWLRESFGPAGAVAVASVLFAAIHVPGYLGQPPVAVVATVAIVAFLAVYLGALYEYTGNLFVPALVHGLYNATQFLLVYGEATGGL
jgi:hypothetical protein